MAKLDEKLAGLATMSLAELRQEWQRIAGSEAPRLAADLLRHAVAHRLQERALGGLPAADRRMLRAVGERLRSGSAPQLKAGTRLLRSWRGRNVSVEVTEGSYLFEDRSFTSLSAIAREVTGTGWSGPRFFGLTASQGTANG
jgi:hypothetical protein